MGLDALHSAPASCKQASLLRIDGPGALDLQALPMPDEKHRDHHEPQHRGPCPARKKTKQQRRIATPQRASWGTADCGIARSRHLTPAAR